MPSHSKTQYRFMRMASVDKEFAKKHKINQRTAKEWHAEDKKKRKEDPEWWDGLPEKIEKDKKSNKVEDISTEGWLSDRILSLFKDKTGKNMEDFLSQIDGDSNNVTQEMLKTGPVEVASAARKLGLLHWSSNWISEVERTINALEGWLPEYFKLRTAFSKKAEAIYKKCESMDPTAAAAWAVPVLIRERDAFLTTIKPLTISNFVSQIVVAPPKAIVTHSPPGAVPHTLPALSLVDVKKLLVLLKRVEHLRNTLDGVSDGEWWLDDTDDARQWMHRYPNNEDWTKFFEYLPCAGAFPHMEVGENKILTSLEAGLGGMILVNLKK